MWRELGRVLYKNNFQHLENLILYVILNLLFLLIRWLDAYFYKNGIFKAKEIKDILIEHTYGSIAFSFNVHCNICFWWNTKLWCFILHCEYVYVCIVCNSFVFNNNFLPFWKGIQWTYIKDYADCSNIQRKILDFQICHVPNLDFNLNSGDKHINSCIWFCSRT